MDIKSEVFKQESFLFRRNLIDPPETLISVRKILFRKLNQKLSIIGRKGIEVERYKRNLDLILMNLFLANRKGMTLRYGRSSQFFIRDKCGLQNRRYIRYRISKEIFDFLELEGLVDQHIGFRKQKNFKTGMLTTIVININMKNLLSRIDVNTTFKSDTRVFNPIVVRSKGKFNEKRDLTFGYILRKFWMIKDRIKKMRRNLDQLNNLYDKSRITVRIPFGILNNVLTDKLERILTHNIPISHLKVINNQSDIYSYTNTYNNISIPNSQMLFSVQQDVSSLNYYKKMPGVTHIELELRKKHVRRIFRDSFKRGGRFYGPIYQSLNKKFRDHMLIDDEETIEIDYDAMHFRMLYHAVGIDYKDDPFAMPTKESRKFVKKLGYIMLNSKNRNSASWAIVAAYAKEGVNITNVTAEDILDKFCARHEPISRFFYNSKWAALHYAESEIVYDILCELKNKGIVGLPIHDSIIVKKKHEDLLRSLMIEKYRDRFKFSPLIS